MDFRIALLLLVFMITRCAIAIGVTLHKEITQPPYDVPCGDQQRACRCPESEESCKFLIIVEELQAFTSYKLIEGYDDFLQMSLERLSITGTNIRSAAGDTYYLDGKGYTPSLPPYPQTGRPSAYGACYLDDAVVTEETFESNNCSVPLTVDGSTFRMLIGINGQIPGPTLIAYEDQIVNVRVVNRLTSEGISIHWHGMHQKQSPWMDGVGFLSQAPIVPGAHFDYIFRAYPPGTHWYHSHVGAQRTDGLFGGLIIMERKHSLQSMGYVNGWNSELFDKPEEHTISLLDWMSEPSLDLYVRIRSSLGHFPDVPIGRIPTQQDALYSSTRSSDGAGIGAIPFWSGLMNGRGRHGANTFTVLSTFEVELGNSYRFRLIGAQSNYAFKFSIDGHVLHLIATDGPFIEREEVDYIIIHTGERYDFILHAKEEIENYWMRAETLETDASEINLAEGILHYAGAGDLSPNNKYANVPERKRECLPSPQQCKAVNCPFKAFPPDSNIECIHLDKLRSKVPLSEPSGLPKILQPTGEENLKFFNFGFEGTSSSSAINSMNLRAPTTPYQTYCSQFKHDVDAGNILCKQNDNNYRHCVHVNQIATSEKKYRPNQEFNNVYPSVNFVLSSVTSRSSHPVHLHGHFFYVVAIGHGTYDEKNTLVEFNQDIDCQGSPCVNPKWRDDKLPPALQDKERVDEHSILKDTVIVPAGGYVVIAFEADNPGYWFMHCHIEAHQLGGMAVIIQEYNRKLQWAPPAGINHVGNFTWTIDQYNQRRPWCYEV